MRLLKLALAAFALLPLVIEATATRQAGADIDELDQDVETALMDACKVDIDRNELLLSPQQAQQSWGIDECRSLMAEISGDVNKGEIMFGFTALMRAAGFGWTEVSKVLISAGAILDKETSEGWGLPGGHTALMFAAQQDWPDICEILISAGADINKKNKEGYGKTALDIAKENNKPRVVDILEKHGASVSSIGVEDILEYLGISDIDEQDEVTKISRSPRPDTPINMRGYTALMYATITGNKDACKRFIEAGADVNKENKGDSGKTALLMAAERGYIDICNMLLAAGADIDKQDTSGTTALMRAVGGYGRGYVDICNILISAGADINKATNNGDTALYLAATFGYTEIVELLITKGAVVDIVDTRKGLTPLMKAAEKGYTEICTLLISAGVDINKKNKDGYGKTALDIAKENKRLKVVDILEKHGASVSDIGLADILKFHEISVSDINKQDVDGYTPLMYAATIGHKDACKILIEAGAYVNKENEADNGKTALLMTAERGHTDICKILVSAGADVNKMDNTGNTALYFAAMYGHSEIIETLITAGADIDKTENWQGTTPLMNAAAYGYKEVCKLLITAGADVDKAETDFLGWTPLTRAASKGYTEICKLLVSVGADIEKKTKYYGLTALMSAAEGRFTNTCKFLISAGADVEKASEMTYHSAFAQWKLEDVLEKH